jgi:O-methyltransferase
MNNNIQERYLDLLKKSLVNELYIENEARLVYQLLCLISKAPINQQISQHIENNNHPIVQQLRAGKENGGVNFIWNMSSPETGDAKKIDLRNLTQVAHTMIGKRRIENIQYCLDDIRINNIPGDLIETGVWRGGAVILMQGYLHACQMNRDRSVWAADSF